MNDKNTNNVGHFFSLKGKHEFMEDYNHAMEVLPGLIGKYDIETSYGVARVYKFGNSSEIPIVLLNGRYASTPNVGTHNSRFNEKQNSLFY